MQLDSSNASNAPTLNDLSQSSSRLWSELLKPRPELFAPQSEHDDPENEPETDDGEEVAA